jgi:hypothetical protein
MRLRSLAMSRLQQLFPSSNLARKLAEPTNARCRIRACPYPSVREGLCRSHLADAIACASTMPSTAGVRSDFRVAV